MEIQQINKIPGEFWQNRDWYAKHFSWYLHTLFPQGIAGVYFLNQKVDFGYKYGASFVGRDAHWFWDVGELERVRNHILEQSKKSRDFVDDIFTKFSDAWEKFDQAYNESEYINISDLSDKELYDLYEKMFIREVELASYGYLADSFLNTGSSDWLVDLISKEFDGKLDIEEIGKIAEVLSAPIFPSFVNQEHADLLKVGVEISNNKELLGLVKKESVGEFAESLKKRKDIWEHLLRHRDSYHWIENNYWEVHDYPVEYFVTKIAEMFEQGTDFTKECEKEIRRAQENKKAKQKLFDEHNVSAELQNIIYNADVFTHMQDMRKQGVLKLNHFLFKFCKELSKRKGISKEETLYTVEPEIKNILLNDKIDREELQKRVDKCFIFFSAKGYKIISGDEVDKIDMKIFYPDLDEVSELKGFPASKGNVSGKVRVVLSNEAIRNFKQGDILVTNNTTPEYVPAMKKAAAIITEQGGITTHAAIVSRELGVPCVIGVQNATRLLKDGDMVEVDAERGIIKIIR